METRNSTRRPRTMKALTLWQPWATLIALGVKQWETRSWMTYERARIAIHAAKRPVEPSELNDDIRQALRASGFAVDGSDLPRGVIVCTAELTSCVRADIAKINFGIGVPEIRFGDFSAGRYAWHLTDVRRVEPPIAVRGGQRLWDFVLPEGWAA